MGQLSVDSDTILTRMDFDPNDLQNSEEETYYEDPQFTLTNKGGKIIIPFGKYDCRFTDKKSGFILMTDLYDRNLITRKTFYAYTTELFASPLLETDSGEIQVFSEGELIHYDKVLT